jgi:alpha-beta hydrolase superfamily lysophospholipase
LSATPLPYSPTHFGPPERAIFGWLHLPQANARDLGVVVCPPIGSDLERAHRALRRLAERLSSTGTPVLRFDFSGTGDSAGDERDSDRVKAWVSDIGLAIDELRARSGVERIAILGMKLGATLAALAASRRSDVDALVLWSPYATGSEFVTVATRTHEMHKVLEPQSYVAPPPGWSSGGEEADGFVLTPQTIADLSAIDLAKVTPQVKHALVVGTGNVRAEDDLVDRFRAAGASADYRHLPGQKFLMVPPHRATLPEAVIDAIATWIGERSTAATGKAPAAKKESGRSEETLVFGEQHPLVGILSRPSQKSEKPALILLNAGAVYRIGPHRLYVSLARRLAELGFPVLRMDLSGIGDSPAAPGCEEAARYPRHAIDDVRAAVIAVEKTLGGRRCIVGGIASGADIAFQVACEEPRVAGAILINPYTFGAHDLEMIERYKRARYYQDSLFRASSWKKALRGQVDFRRAIGMVLPKVTDVVKRRVGELLRPAEADSSTENSVAHRMLAMVGRGVDTLMIASEAAPGVDYFDAHFGNELRELRSTRGFRREDLKGTDQTFTSRYAQQIVGEVIVKHLSERFR